MSEMPESTPEPAAPTPTAEIASQAFDAFEAGTDPGDEAPATSQVETAPAEPPAPVAEPPAANPEDTEIESLLSEFGFKDARKPDGREHYIPRSKVLKMIGSGLKRGQEKWTTERGVLEQQTAELRSAVEQIVSGIHGEPEALLAELATLNPAFQRFLQTGQAPPPADASRPEPDLDLGNGQRTYTPDGLEKLLQWQVRQALDQRLSPIERQVKERERAQQEQAQYAAIQTTIQKATDWPGFGPLAEDGSLTPFQQAVLEKLREDSQQAARERRRPSMSFRQAYLEVYAEKMTADSGRMRETVLREVAQAPKAPALSRSAGEAPKVTGPRTTADAAARALSRLERGA